MLQIFDFLRPGNADHLSEVSAIQRALNKRGRDQALALRAHLDNPSYNLLLSSPSTQSRQTLSLVAGVAEEDVSIMAELTINPLSGDLARRVEGLFDELSYDSIAAYLRASDGNAVLEYGIAAWQRIQREATERQSFRVGICGHPILLTAIGVSACGDSKSYFKSQLLELKLGECQGFSFVFKEGAVIDYHQIL